MAKKPSPIEVIRRRRVFVGRDDERDAFRRNFDCEPSEQCFIFAFHGQAGIGKSFLVARYQEIARAKGALTAVTNEAEATAVREQSIVRAMARLASQLADAGAPLDTFDESHRKYRGSMHQIEADPDAPLGTFGKLARATARIATGAAKATLVGQAAEGALRELGAGEDRLVDWAEAGGRYLAKKLKGKHDLVALVKEPVETLTPLFVQNLNALAHDRPVVLCFDTWERTSPHLDAWLRFLYEREGLSAGVWLVIAGRHPPGDAWEPFLPVMACFELQEFTEDETRDYLRKQDIIDEARVEQIIAFSGGVPVLVSTLASATGGTATEAANGLVDRYLKWVDDPRHRQAALRCAPARRLDKDVVAAVMGPDDADALFNWLTGMPFVQTRPGYWEYHPKVRKLMLRFARSRSLKDANAVHARLRAYYRDLLAARGDEPRYRDETWRRCALEALYHGLMQESADAEREGLETFLLALRPYYPLAGEVATAWSQAAEELETATDLTNWAEVLAAGWAAWEGESWKEVVSSRQALAHRHDLSDAARAALHFAGGFAYGELNDYDRAAADYDRAIELDPENAVAYNNRGWAYAGLGHYERAIADYNRAIELDPEYTKAYINRGLAYTDLKDYERAIADYARAIDLDPEYATAYYNTACAYALQQKVPAACDWLQKAIALDDKYQQMARTDDDFDPIRDHPSFQALLAALPAP